MISIAAIGDPHFKTTNMEIVNLFIDKVISLISEKSPDIIIILGDLLHEHERLHTTPLNKAYEFIEKLRSIAPVYILVGNHDMINNRQFLTPNHWMNGLKEWENVKIIDKPLQVTIKELEFVFCPYVPPGRLQDALNTLGEWQNARAIFCHQEFYGCKMGAIISTEGDKWDSTLPYVVSGHIHSNQTLDNVYYPGAAIQHAFGESERNIIPFFVFQQNSKELEEIDLQLPRKKIIYINVEDIEEFEKPDTDDKIRLTVSGTYEQFKTFKKSAKYKNMLTQGVKIVYKHTKVVDTKTYENTTSNFFEILKKLIDKEGNQFLREDFLSIM